jgi:Tfp pilus assembly protein PilP|tara:strand:- start:350 stop:796 length:447 start_codon:yes stop_codon:yes gene_type:complete
MSFFRIFLIIIFISAASNSFADESTENQNATDKAQEIVNQAQEEDEVPLNDPFAGNEGTSSMSNIPEDEQEDEMSLYNFKLAGLISGKDHSYISLVNSGGEIITLTLGQYLGKNKFVDLRLSEAIFEKEDKTFIIIDFNNQIREANEY